PTTFSVGRNDGTAGETATLTDNSEHTWAIVASQPLTLAVDLTVANVEVVQGGGGSDSFDLGDGASVDEISAGGGDDSFFLAADSFSLTGSLDGGSDNDVLLVGEQVTEVAIAPDMSGGGTISYGPQSSSSF